MGSDSHFLYLMQRFVRTSAHQIILANLDDDVLALVKCEQPVAIIIEVDHPESTSWRTLRTLETRQGVKRIPIMACSWLDEEARGLAEGADIYLRMPIMYSDFEAALATILRKVKNE